MSKSKWKPIDRELVNAAIEAQIAMVSEVTLAQATPDNPGLTEADVRVKWDEEVEKARQMLGIVQRSVAEHMKSLGLRDPRLYDRAITLNFLYLYWFSVYSRYTGSDKLGETLSQTGAVGACYPTDYGVMDGNLKYEMFMFSVVARTKASACFSRASQMWAIASVLGLPCDVHMCRLNGTDPSMGYVHAVNYITHKGIVFAFIDFTQFIHEYYATPKDTVSLVDLLELVNSKDSNQYLLKNIQKMQASVGDLYTTSQLHYIQYIDRYTINSDYFESIKRTCHQTGVLGTMAAFFFNSPIGKKYMRKLIHNVYAYSLKQFNKTTKTPLTFNQYYKLLNLHEPFMIDLVSNRLREAVTQINISFNIMFPLPTTASPWTLEELYHITKVRKGSEEYAKFCAQVRNRFDQDAYDSLFRYSTDTRSLDWFHGHVNKSLQNVVESVNNGTLKSKTPWTLTQLYEFIQQYTRIRVIVNEFETYLKNKHPEFIATDDRWLRQYLKDQPVVISPAQAVHQLG